MEIKTVQPQKVFFKTIESSLQTLTSDVGEIPNQLEQELQENKLTATGPQTWVYRGSDGNPNTKFTLDICLPIDKNSNGNGQVKTLEQKKCAMEVHKGTWANLGETYQKMMAEIAQKGETPTFVSREVYVHCDFVNQENCITEVYIELQ